MFDATVNHGIGNSIRFLQRAAGVADDGLIGPVTMAVVRAMTVTDVLARFNAARRAAAVEEQRDIAQQQAKALEKDVAAGRATAGRLRCERDMLEGVQSAGREVAEYADLLRVAGLACERAFDGIRG